jgi:hypothetical protein
MNESFTIGGMAWQFLSPREMELFFSRICEDYVRNGYGPRKAVPGDL